jgi:hypothetical protein
MSAQAFAHSLLSELRILDPRAQALKMKSKGDQVILGIEDDEKFVPLLRLGAATAKFNKMMLFVYHQGHWQPTFQKGTAKMLAELLASSLNYLWTIPLSFQGWNPDLPPSTTG